MGLDAFARGGDAADAGHLGVHPDGLGVAAVATLDHVALEGAVA